MAFLAIWRAQILPPSQTEQNLGHFNKPRKHLTGVPKPKLWLTHWNKLEHQTKVTVIVAMTPRIQDAKVNAKRPCFGWMAVALTPYVDNWQKIENMCYESRYAVVWWGCFLKRGSHLVHCIFGEYMQAEIRRQSLLSIFLAFVVGLGLVPQAAATKKVCG